PQGPSYVFLTNTSGGALIPVPDGWSSPGDPHVNDLGQIVATVAQNSIFRIALSTTASTFLIPAPTGVQSVTGPRLNNRGQVVGQISGGSGGWIWDASNGTRLLQNLVPPGWTILSADGINDQGQILARASNTSGFSGPVILDPGIVNIDS